PPNPPYTLHIIRLSFSPLPPPPRPTLFPYTTLFRSDAYRARYGTAMPVRGGAAAIMVPGVVSGWWEAHRTSRDALGSPIPWKRRSEEHTSELQSRGHLVCRLLLEKKKKTTQQQHKNA